MSDEIRRTAMDERVKAVRENGRVGRGTCTTIDETYSDDELAAALDEAGETDAIGAVSWAIALEGLRIENALNSRWGADDDPELVRYKEWQKADADDLQTLAAKHPTETVIDDCGDVVEPRAPGEWADAGELYHEVIGLVQDKFSAEAVGEADELLADFCRALADAINQSNGKEGDA